MYTKEEDLRDLFSKYGDIEKCLIVFDTRVSYINHQSQRSRGFGFITYRNLDDATTAKEALNGTVALINQELNERNIRVDYSVTKGGHQSTPGQYMGVRRSGSPHRPRRYSRSPSPRRRR